MKHSDKVLVLYDGKCGFCKWSVNLALRFDRDGRLEPTPLQTPGVLEPYNIPLDNAKKALHVVSRDGKVYSAGGALAIISRNVAWLWPAYYLWKLPGLAWLADRLYFLIAENRDTIGKVLSSTGVKGARCSVSYDDTSKTASAER